MIINIAIKKINQIRKKYLTTDTREKLFGNFLSLSILQIANYILPLITLPYLVRILGPEKFGLVTFSQAFISYFIILTDYGFNLSATREISINRGNKVKVIEIFNSVMIIKLFLIVISFVIMTIIVSQFQKFKQDWLIYYLTFGMVLGQVLFPVWFFQGIERMNYITKLNIIAKLIFTVSIFMFIKKPEDYIILPIINSFGSIIAGLLGIRIVFKKFRMKIEKVKLENIKFHLKEGGYIFFSSVATSFYTLGNIFILGLFTNNIIVGYYAGAEKIIRAIQGLLGPISQTVYPHISKLMNDSKEDGIKFIKKLFVYFGGFSFSLSFFVFIFNDLLVKVLLGKQYSESVIVLRILAFIPFIVGLSNILGIQTMLTLNYQKAFIKIILFASLINLILSLILVQSFKHIGISISVLVTEISVTLLMMIYLYKKGIKIIGVYYV